MAVPRSTPASLLQLAKSSDLLLLAFTLTLLSSSALRSEATQIVLQQGKEIPRVEFKGNVRLSVVPPFDGARITIFVDGSRIITRVGGPYVVDVDLGATAAEHTIRVTAESITGKTRLEWLHVINRGASRLSVKLKYFHDVRQFEAAVNAPAEDPVEVVEFYHEGAIIGRDTTPPYRLTVAPGEVPTPLFANARTKSGAEETDHYAGESPVHVESYDVRSVPIYVSVVDDKGSVRSDLDRQSFRILDKGSEAKIVEFAKAFDDPISVALVIDSSASMTHQMRSVVAAASEFVSRSLHPGDRISVFSIHGVPRRRLAIQDDLAAASAALSAIEPSGGTALHDSVAAALRELEHEKRRCAIIIFSDGEDTASIVSSDELLEKVRLTGIPIYSIVYGQPDSLQRHLDGLRYVSSESGGFLALSSDRNLAARFAQIEQDLRAKYAIKYQIANVTKAREWRPIRVMLRAPNLTARTIGGYFTP